MKTEQEIRDMIAETIQQKEGAEGHVQLYCEGIIEGLEWVIEND